VQACIDPGLYPPLTEELQHSGETHGGAALLSKVVSGDVRPGV
jgi:hypothetical protein